MKMKLLTMTLALIISSLSFAATITVEMSKNCRDSNGNFRGYAESAEIEMIPANESSYAALELQAKKAAQTGRYVIFKIDGAILGEQIISHPRMGEYRVIKFLVKTAE